MALRRPTATYGRNRQNRITTARRLAANDWSIDSDDDDALPEEESASVGDQTQVATASTTTGQGADGTTRNTNEHGSRDTSPSHDRRSSHSPSNRKTACYISPLASSKSRARARNVLNSSNSARRPLMSKTNSQTTVAKPVRDEAPSDPAADKKATSLDWQPNTDTYEDPLTNRTVRKLSGGNHADLSAAKRGRRVPFVVIPNHDQGKENIPPPPSPVAPPRRRGRTRATQATPMSGDHAAQSSQVSQSDNTIGIAPSVRPSSPSPLVGTTPSSPNRPTQSSDLGYNISTSSSKTLDPLAVAITHSSRPVRTTRRHAPSYNEDDSQSPIHAMAPARWSAPGASQTDLTELRNKNERPGEALPRRQIQEEAKTLTVGAPRGTEPSLEVTAAEQDLIASSDASHILSTLLDTCFERQTAPLPFDTLLDSLVSAYRDRMPEHLPSSSARPARAPSSTLRSCTHASEALQFIKIGEATYSEVFKVDAGEQGSFAGRPDFGSVLKVIPLVSISADEADGKSWPECSSFQDAIREIKITRLMGEVDKGFIRMTGAHVVSGSYPSRLLRGWDEYAKKKRGAENIRPSVLPPSQLYLVLTLHDGGPDLETSRLTSWLAAASIFFQVARALASGERSAGFEHRDLHWGNVLVQKQPVRSQMQLVCSPSAKLAGTAKIPHPTARSTDPEAGMPRKKVHTLPDILDPAVSGVRARIIDFTLSRVLIDGDVVAYDFEDDSIFEGEGDIQFDVYRQMREHMKGNWQKSHPLTNIFWLHYLVTKLLQDKHLKSPSPVSTTFDGSSSSSAPSSRETRQRTERACYAALRAVRRALEPALHQVSTSAIASQNADHKVEETANTASLTNSAEAAREKVKFPTSAKRLMRWAEARLLS